MPAPETEAPTAHDILGDAMFNGKIKSVIVVAIEEDGSLTVSHSWEHPITLVGMLETAKMQTLARYSTDEKPCEEDDDG